MEISVKLHSTSSICATVSESHYPPLHLWSHQDIVNGKVSISNAVPEIHLQCDNGHSITSITFASFGTPQGSCQKFSQGDCHAPNSFAVVSEVSIIQQEIRYSKNSVFCLIHWLGRRGSHSVAKIQQDLPFLGNIG